jgi:hypothetical protein
MTRTWNDLEGVSLNGRYWLKQCLADTENDAWFLTRFDQARDAAVRVVRAGDAEPDRLEMWRAAMAIDHPHLVRMLDAGRADAEGMDVIYAVCEYPDDFLVSALAERPLSTAEAGAVLDACLQVLGFLHERGLVHGGVAAEHIMAFGDRIKLPSDRIQRRGNPAQDLWELGATLVEMLTRERPRPGDAVPWLPEPFGTIVQRTMGEDPGRRWTVEDIETHLRPVSEPEILVLPTPEPEREAEPEPVRAAPAPEPMAAAAARHGYGLKWVGLAGLAAAAGLGAFFLPHSAPPVAKPAVQTAPAPAAPAPRVAAPPSPARNAEARPSPTAIWRVVVYEYSRRAAAEQKAQALNQKQPELHAQVFAPRGNHAPYLVALGGFMTYDEAERVKKRARAAGMPRDTFVRNYAR